MCSAMLIGACYMRIKNTIKQGFEIKNLTKVYQHLNMIISQMLEKEQRLVHLQHWVVTCKSLILPEKNGGTSLSCDKCVVTCIWI